MDGVLFWGMLICGILASVVYLNQRGNIYTLETTLKQEQIHSDRLATMLEEHDMARNTIADVLSYAGQRQNTNRTFPLRQRKKTWGYVYLMSINDEYHKIGYARNVKSRLGEMQVSTPYPIKVVHMIVTGNAPVLEVILQNRFADKWVAGEWFKLDQEDIDTICSLNAAVTLADLDQVEHLL